MTSIHRRIGRALKRTSPRRSLWPAYRELLRRSSRPILVGPFRGEVGFEALYFLPWLHAQGFDNARLIPISRGGAGTWYGTPKSVELYALRTPKEVRIENRLQLQQTGLLKQMRIGAFDAAVLRDAAKALGETRYHVLHPSWMYHDLAPFWEGQRGLEWLWPRITRSEVTKDGKPSRVMRTPAVVPLPEGSTLPPPPFIAARFYLRSTFPQTPATLATAKATLAKLAQKHPVVLLNSGVHADEHVDLRITGPNIVTLTDLIPSVTPQNNLLIQNAVIAQAAGFVGTYGGLAQLALRHRKPVVSFYQDWQGTAIAHKHLSDALALTQGCAFLCLRLNEIPMLNESLPELQFSS